MGRYRHQFLADESQILIFELNFCSLLRKEATAVFSTDELCSIKNIGRRKNQFI